MKRLKGFDGLAMSIDDDAMLRVQSLELKKLTQKEKNKRRILPISGVGFEGLG